MCHICLDLKRFGIFIMWFVLFQIPTSQMRWRRSRIMCCKCTKSFLCSSDVAFHEFPLNTVRKAFKREFPCYWSKEKKTGDVLPPCVWKLHWTMKEFSDFEWQARWLLSIFKVVNNFASVFSCRTYSAIVTLEQRQRYQRDFSAEYDEYKDLHSRIATITHMFVQLESKIKSLSRGTPEYKVLTVCTSLSANLSVSKQFLHLRFCTLQIMEDQILEKYNKYREVSGWK